MDDTPRPTAFRVTLLPQQWTFDAPPDQTLLLAGLAAGIRLPHSCRNGTCRACITQMTAGEIQYRIEWPGLSREEKQEGWILPCVAQPRSDITLDAPRRHAHRQRSSPRRAACAPASGALAIGPGRRCSYIDVKKTHPA